MSASTDTASVAAANPTRGTGRRGSRLLVGGLVAVLIALLVLTVALGGGSGGGGELDPRDGGPDGAAGLVGVLRAQGVDVDEISSAVDLPTDATTTTVVTQAWSLSDDVLDRLVRGSGPLVLVTPDDATLARLVPRLTGSGDEGPGGVATVAPDCSDDDARAVGTVRVERRIGYAPADGGDGRDDASFCYPVGTVADGDDDQQATAIATPAAARRQAPAGLVRSRDGDRAIDVLGMPELLANDRLDEAGNAALALRLTGRTPRVAWYSPTFEDTTTGSDQTLFGLVPAPVRWGLLQLMVAVVVALLWRGRRQGRLVTEPLPVVVRAAETEEGRARLYVRAGARGRSAAILRTAALRRLARRFDVPATGDVWLVVALVAEQTRRDPGEVAALLVGPEPTDDEALVRLARDLDALEYDVGGKAR